MSATKTSPEGPKATRMVMTKEVEARRKAITKASAQRVLKLRQEAWDRRNAK